MTEFERKRVLDILTAKIRANVWGSIKLNQVSPILQEEGIDRSIYGGIGPKRWLGEHFPELVIDGSNGMETVQLAEDSEARELRQIASVLETWVKSEDSVLFANIPERLKTQCGIDYHKYAEGKGLQQWLFSTFPQFDKSEDGRLLIFRAEQAAPQPTDSGEEIRQMHAVAFMNWWNINTRQLHQYNTFEGMKDSEIRDAVAHQMGAALLGQNGLLLNAVEDDPSRLAFPTGLTTSGGETIYCVLEVNPRNENGTKQHLRLAGFCYPDEPAENGLGKWLAERFALSSHRFPVADYGQLRDRIEALEAAREELLPQVEEYLRALNRGEAPAAALEQRIGGYERRWSELERMLRDFPSLHAMRPRALHTLKEKLDECGGCAELAAQAASAMDEVINGVCRLYEANHLGDLRGSTPERDRERLHALCGPEAGGTDASALLAILKPYQKLLTVMKAQVYQEAEDALEEVTGHFTEISYKFATQVLIASREEDYRPLLDLDRIEGLVRQCMTVAASGQRADNRPAEPMDADELLDQALRRERDWPLRWITCISSLMPEDEREQALVLGDEESLRRLLTAPEREKLEHVTMEATPFGAASRLLKVQGNRDRLAEKYLLLGLQYDQERCVPVLYRLYREADQRAQFEALWNQYSKKLPYSDDDLIYWFAIRSADPGSDGAYLDELEAFLAEHPDRRKNDRLKKYLQNLTPQLQYRPAAFWSWLGVGSMPSNTFESALENNDLERIYAVLDDASGMRAMGYTEEETGQIRAALGRDLPSGMDAFSKALRVLSVQRNKNGTAERLLWAAVSSTKAALSLFDLYNEKGDSASVCWLVEHLSIRLSEQDARSGAYIRSLIEQHQRGALAAFMKLHPTLLYREGVLDELAIGEREQPEREKIWIPLQSWHAAHPISSGCAFEKALAEGDLAVVRDCLAQPAQMEAWGYPEPLREQIEHALEQSTAPEQGEQAAALRIWTFQGNLHRFLEGYLYQSLEKGQGWSYQELFRLMFEEKRYREAVAYQRYQLNLLEGGSMVPFDLAYEADEDQEELHYALSGKFTAEGGEEEQIMPVEGVLRLEDLSDLDFHYGIYQVDVPCTEENYTERRDIQQILNMYFGPQNSFSRFPNLAIYGMKRTGKSSVLRRLEYMFRTRPEGAPYYVETSGEGARGSVLERVYFILVNRVLNKLGYRFQMEPGWEAMRQKWEAFCQKWETCPAATTPQKWGWLNEFYTSLGHEWFRDTGLVVLVDEVENLYWDYGEPDGETGMETVEDTEESGVALYITDSDADAPGSTDTSGLWDTISNIMQAENSPIRFVLCGSDFFTNKMVLEGDNLTQLFQRIVKLSVGRMANKELNQSMRATEGEHNDLCYHERSLEYLWSMTGGLPWHSKKIVNTIIEKRLVYMEGAVREIIYPSDIIWGVDRILNDPIASSDGNYGMVALTADERVLLDILTEELRTASTWISDDTLRTYFHARVGEESWEKRYERAMKTLISERQMIKSRGKDQSGPYQFGCELYRLYNRREQPEQFVIR